MSTSVQGLRIEVLQPGQLDEAARFLESEKAGGLDKDEWLAKFGVLWDQNPFFDTGFHARGWVVVDENEAILGFLGNVPVRYVRESTEEACYWATTWFVAEKARAHSLDLFRKFMAQDGVLFDTTPTPGVELILAKRFKFARLDSEWIKADYILPIHLRPCAVFVKWRLGNRPLLRPFSVAACMAVQALTWCRSVVGRLKRHPGIEVKEIDASPADLDGWWASYKRQRSYTLVRDDRSMRWLYFSGAYCQSRKVLEIRRGGALLGFVSLKRNRQPAFAIVELVDWAMLDLNEDCLSTIIIEVREAVRRWGEDVAFLRTNAFNARMADLLSRSGFWKFGGKSRYYYFDRTRKLSPGALHATPVDGDRSLFP